MRQFFIIYYRHLQKFLHRAQQLTLRAASDNWQYHNKSSRIQPEVPRIETAKKRRKKQVIVCTFHY